MTGQARKVTTAAIVGTCAQRFGLLLVVWWILTDGTGGWGFGVPLAALATFASLWLTPPGRLQLRILRLPFFAVFFLRQSLRAGCDVARRTLSPAMPLQPAILHLMLELPEGAPTWWLMTTISLLPGTLSVRLDGRELELHCLDSGQDVAGGVREAEIQLACLFGSPISMSERGRS